MPQQSALPVSRFLFFFSCFGVFFLACVCCSWTSGGDAKAAMSISPCIHLGPKSHSFLLSQTSQHMVQGLCTNPSKDNSLPVNYLLSVRMCGDSVRVLQAFFFFLFSFTSKTYAQISRTSHCQAKSRPQQVCSDLCDPPQLSVRAQARVRSLLGASR